MQKNSIGDYYLPIRCSRQDFIIYAKYSSLLKTAKIQEALALSLRSQELARILSHAATE